MHLSSRRFLDKLSLEAPYYLSLPFLWTVEIYNMPKLAGEINNTTTKIARWGRPWRANQGMAHDWGRQNILVAREATLPSEQSSFLEAGQNNRGGFMPGYGMQQRESYIQRSLALNFIETITDIVHEFFTPWSVAIGVDGLTNFDLKTNITVKQYDTQGRRRKGYMFIDAFPTVVEGFTLTQEPGAVYHEKTVTFCFTDYLQL